MSLLLDQVKVAWGKFDLAALDKLEPLYHSDVRFIEPAGEIRGRDALFKHFRQSCHDLTHCRFEFDGSMEVIDSTQGFLVWEMTFKHKKLNQGNEIIVPGTTYLEFTDSITLHRDWFDLGVTVYENIPLLGRVIKSVKLRLHDGTR